MIVSRIFDWPLTGSRWHLFEWCDLSITPLFIKHCCQATLTAQWTHKLPVIQRTCPAELAAALITRALDDIEDINTERYTVIDFCSGAGGPIPVIEKSVNQSRALHQHAPIAFRVSDINPNIDAWMEISSRSANLSFIPQPVDATSAPPSVISKTSSRCPFPASATKTFHLYSLSFHHFDERAAEAVMESTLRTSDGFALVELQDRALGTMALMSGEFALLMLLTALWFPYSWLHLIFTYWVPILPFVQLWDGLVSCLRTRSFEEVLLLAERALGEKSEVVEVVSNPRKGWGREDIAVAVCGDWRFTSVRAMHTWPFGYMNAVVGHRIQ